MNTHDPLFGSDQLDMPIAEYEPDPVKLTPLGRDGRPRHREYEAMRPIKQHYEGLTHRLSDRPGAYDAFRIPSLFGKDRMPSKFAQNEARKDS